MAGLERFDNRAWERFFDFLALDVRQMSDEEVDAELQHAGIDLSSAVQSVYVAIEAHQARLALRRAKETRAAQLDAISSMVVEEVVNARDIVLQLISRRVPQNRQLVYLSKLQQAASDSDLSSLLEDIKRLEQLELGEGDGRK